MSVMTAQLPLPMAPTLGAVDIGAVVALVEDDDGGRVFLRGELVYAWSGDDVALRRLAAVQLVEINAATRADVAAGFGVDSATVWRWSKELSAAGVAGLIPDKRGPKGAHRVTASMREQITARRGEGAPIAAIAAAVGVSASSVRRVLSPVVPVADGVLDDVGQDEQNPNDQNQIGSQGATPADEDELPTDDAESPAPVLPVLAVPMARTGERAAARWGMLEYAPPVFTAAARVPLAGLFLAIPGIAATGLLEAARNVYGKLPDGFYGLDTMLVEATLRTLAGAARAEAATRIDPVALGRVLGMDRAPEVKTIRRKISQLATTGKAEDLLAAIAARHLARLDATDPSSAVVFYVDGHVRAYQGTRRISKTHSARLRFPAPATVETWVSDAAGDPVLVVMAEPAASLASELRRLLPELRAVVGDDRRVLVGFDRGGWSPELFAHMHAEGFDVLTWRKGPAIPDIGAESFTEVTHTDDHGRQLSWQVADTTVELPVGTDPDTGSDRVFALRQITKLVTDPKNGPDATRQVHILTTRTDLDAGEVIYRMGSRWRQENYFRYARMHFDLDSHDSYAVCDDDPARLVPNPAKKKAHQQVLTARARLDRATARTDAALLAARSPAPGTEALITNTAHDAMTIEQRDAETALTNAQHVHRAIPARLPLEQVNPGQQVLDTETKLITHAIRMAAFNTATALARAIRVHTSYARADQEAHTLIRQTLTGSGDIDTTTPGVLTIRLDPMPTARATAAISELCEHLTATETRYPATELIMRYEIKSRP